MKLLPISYQSNVSQNSNYLSKNNSKNYSSSTTFKSIMPAEQILGMAQKLKAHNHPQANSIISDIISELSKQSGKTCDISDKLYNRINCALNDIQPKQNNNVLLDVLKLLLEHRKPGSGSQSSSNIYRSHSSYSHSSSKPRDYEKEARERNERIHKQSWDDYFEKNPSPTIGSSLMGP